MPGFRPTEEIACLPTGASNSQGMSCFDWKAETHARKRTRVELQARGIKSAVWVAAIGPIQDLRARVRHGQKSSTLTLGVVGLWGMSCSDSVFPVLFNWYSANLAAGSISSKRCWATACCSKVPTLANSSQSFLQTLIFQTFQKLQIHGFEGILTVCFYY